MYLLFRVSLCGKIKLACFDKVSTGQYVSLVLCMVWFSACIVGTVVS